MKDYRIAGPERMEVFEVPVPEFGMNEVLVKVKVISICGSDVHLYQGTYNGPKNYPISFGHEWAGEVVGTGSGVTRFSVGDRVTGDCSRYCGECAMCQIDRNLCMNIEKFGITVDGNSVEYVVRDERYLYRLPDDMDFSLGAIAEPVGVGAHLLQRIGRPKNWYPGKKILVAGVGGIGMGLVFLLRNLYGATDITVTDPNCYRLETAEKLGAAVLTEPFDSRRDLPDDYHTMYSVPGYDLIIETTGRADVFVDAFAWVAPRGILACLGMIPEVPLKQKVIVLKAMEVVGSIGATGNFEEVIDCVARYPEDARTLVSHRLTMTAEGIREAFATIRRNQDSLKVQLIL